MKYKDLTTDGIIYDKNSSPTTQIFIGINDGVILSHTRNSDDATPDHNKYFYKRYYSSKSVNGYTLHRQIHSFVNSQGLRSPFALILYNIIGPNGNKHLNLSHNPFLTSHGNSTSQEIYIRTKPTIRERIMELGAFMRPKQIIRKVVQEAGGLISATTPSDLPRDRNQVYNLSRGIENRKRHRNTGKGKIADFSKIAVMANTGKFIQNHNHS